MYQGEFIEKVLAGALSEPDIKAFIKSQPKEDLLGLLNYINDRQGAILADSLFKKDNDYFNMDWRVQYNKLQAVKDVINCFRDQPLKLPTELDTELVRLLFNRAIEKGYIDIDNNCYKWCDGKKVRLAYFCERVFCRNMIETLPETLIRRLFPGNISNRIGSALNKLHNNINKQRWQEKMDKDLFF